MLLALEAKKKRNSVPNIPASYANMIIRWIFWPWSILLSETSSPCCKGCLCTPHLSAPRPRNGWSTSSDPATRGVCTRKCQSWLWIVHQPYPALIKRDTKDIHKRRWQFWFWVQEYKCCLFVASQWNEIRTCCKSPGSGLGGVQSQSLYPGALDSHPSSSSPLSDHHFTLSDHHFTFEWSSLHPWVITISP